VKVGVVGAGAVGRACVLSLLQRGSCREIVLVNRTRETAAGVITDARYARPLLAHPVDLSDGDYADLAGCAVVLVTIGVNEKSGGATDRDDPKGRLRLLDNNAKVYRKTIPQIVEAAPDAVLLIVTDPPDPLTDIAREAAGHERVFGTGTLIDSLRLRVHIARRVGVDPASVDATVVGEHGKSSVALWSTATVAGAPVAELLAVGDDCAEKVQSEIAEEVANANITIIEGIGASQYGIGIISARIAEAVLRDEGCVLPVGSYHEQYRVTLSLPAVVGARGVRKTLMPRLSESERNGLEHSVQVLREALAGA
jgi:L-lactate dehydrogenase